jgi:hypothetical protein
MKIRHKNGRETKLRGKLPPPVKRIPDKRKESNKRACRGN